LLQILKIGRILADIRHEGEGDMENACVIIDDPLLTENYGHLNFRKLLALMDKHNFHCTVAFIPWNYNRYNKNIAGLFRDRQDRFSICVHGCDHTRGEFGSTDINRLIRKIWLATERMIEFSRRTGIPFERVFVPPQHIFSNIALDALRLCFYHAVTNWVDKPVDGDKITSKLPFYKRYEVSELPLDANPALIMMHHMDFANGGYARLGILVDKLNANGAKWGSVGECMGLQRRRCRPVSGLSGVKVNGVAGVAGVAIRRYLSEVRDNYISKNDFALRIAVEAKERLLNY